MSARPAVVWFRNDLRLADNRALSAAVASGAPIVPLFILDDAAAATWAPGGASRWWLDKSLAALAAALAAHGGRLVLKSGATAAVLASVVRETGAEAVYFTRAYEPWARRLEEEVKAVLERDGAAIKRYGGALLREPEEVRTGAGQPFKVYTPFWRALVALGEPRKPMPAPAQIAFVARWPKSDRLASWALHPSGPDWSKGLAACWVPGEAGAAAQFARFVATALGQYADGRNRPDRAGTSRLSPHLHFGEISPAMCWHGARAAAEAHGHDERSVETFLKELVWREFSSHLLYHWPGLPEVPFRREFASFPWRADDDALKRWQRGRTGFPIVDAGMRELWATGYMHNRVRMIAASFLVKDLLVPWQAGEAWFWDTLVDADLASNAASWQWVAGSGADAAPYFRIFNPVTQGVSFDPEGDYVRRWVPELARLPATAIHAPWTAPACVLGAAGVELGRTYPFPIVDHAIARRRALEAHDKLKALKS